MVNYDGVNGGERGASEPGALPDDTGVKADMEAAYAETLQGKAGGLAQALSSLMYGDDGPPEPVYLVDGLPLDKWRWYYAVDWTNVLVTVVIALALIISVILVTLALTGAL